MAGFIPTQIERPHFSDKTGNFKIDPKKIKCDHGWVWESKRWLPLKD